MNALEDIEISMLLEGIYQYHGYDFRHYARASLRRRILARVQAEGLQTISGLQERVLHDPACMNRLLLGLTVHVTSMFRDPSFYASFRRNIVPMLKTYPFLRIWHAGCSTGEEVYSMAILLHEEGLYSRSRIYASDLSEAVVQRAKAGIFPLSAMKGYSDNYLRAGGASSLSEYYTASHDNVLFRPWLRDNVVFSTHNLVTDASFNEFQVIICRNVMIYFDMELQNRTLDLLHQSLVRHGVLALGKHESLRLTRHELDYEALDPSEKLYRRVQ